MTRGQIRVEGISADEFHPLPVWHSGTEVETAVQKGLHILHDTLGFFERLTIAEVEVN